jgi:hypothetical protein
MVTYMWQQTCDSGLSTYLSNYQLALIRGRFVLPGSSARHCHSIKLEPTACFRNDGIVSNTLTASRLDWKGGRCQFDYEPLCGPHRLLSARTSRQHKHQQRIRNVDRSQLCVNRNVMCSGRR